MSWFFGKFTQNASLFSKYTEAVDWLNYHHLLYFWTVARLGSVTKAADELRLGPATVSAQVRRLEESLGEKLFQKSGRRLVLTEMGHVACRYADEIFSLGHELTDTMKGRPTGHPVRLRIGVSDVLPKRIAYRLIKPALQLATPVRVLCREERPARLLAALAVHELDVILSDSPVGPEVSVRAFNHPLGECGMGFYATPKLARKRPRSFPKSLNGMPMLLPTDSMAIRHALDQWFELNGVHPAVVGEFDDYSLLIVFAAAGHGIFAAPWVLDQELRRQFGFVRIGRTNAVRARFFAISAERKIKNPAVVAICEASHEKSLD
jgi:LysR family transcriptional regulator, transcriptional activator of nhaA